jgi:hypothetical protein
MDMHVLLTTIRFITTYHKPRETDISTFGQPAHDQTCAAAVDVVFQTNATQVDSGLLRVSVSVDVELDQVFALVPAALIHSD